MMELAVVQRSVRAYAYHEQKARTVARHGIAARGVAGEGMDVHAGLDAAQVHVQALSMYVWRGGGSGRVNPWRGYHRRAGVGTLQAQPGRASTFGPSWSIGGCVDNAATDVAGAAAAALPPPWLACPPWWPNYDWVRVACGCGCVADDELRRVIKSLFQELGQTAVSRNYAAHSIEIKSKLA